MSREQILDMLDKGAINADEAARLLEAVSATDRENISKPLPAGGPAQEQTESIEPDQILSSATTPDTSRWDRFRQIPFAISVTILILSAWGLYALFPKAETGITFGWIIVLLVFMIAVLATIVSFSLLSAPWLHIRIQEPDGKRIAISFPIPLVIANWGIAVARRFVDEQTAGYLDMSSGFLQALRRDANDEIEPIQIDVDENGQRVQIYIG
jgi:hypothetical protein